MQLPLVLSAFEAWPQAVLPWKAKAASQFIPVTPNLVQCKPHDKSLVDELGLASLFFTPAARLTLSSSVLHCKLPVMFAGITTVALSCSILEGFMIGDGPRLDSIDITAEMAGSTTTATVIIDSRVLAASVTTTVTELVVLSDDTAGACTMIAMPLVLDSLIAQELSKVGLVCWHDHENTRPTDDFAPELGSTSSS